MSEYGVPRGSFKVITANQLQRTLSEKSDGVQYAAVNKPKENRQTASTAPVEVPRNSFQEDLQQTLKKKVSFAGLESPPRQTDSKEDDSPVPPPRRKRSTPPTPPKPVIRQYPQTRVPDGDDDSGEYVCLRNCKSSQESDTLSPPPTNSSPCIDFDVFLMEEDKKLKGVLELSTLKHDVIDKVNLRVVCLFDVSGSMLLKCGRSRRHSKLAVLRKMAADLVDVLDDDEDLVGLVTFGDTANTVWPLTRITTQNRADVKQAIANFGQVTCSETDLYSGVEHAINLLKEDDHTSRLIYRNAIIIFSDGEINKGVTDPESLVSRVRDAIRTSNVTSELQTDQWLSIACVTTGGFVSNAMYLLSKYCGNDAFYYLDNQLDHPEVDMMIPLLLRKSAIAQFVTLSVSTINGAQLKPTECTREHSIRKRKTAHTENKQMTYYLHDFAAGMEKHFAVAIDLARYDMDNDNGLMWVNLEYADAKGNIQTVSKSIKFSDRLTLIKGPDGYNKGILEKAKQEMRSLSQTAFRRTAMIVEQEDNSHTVLPLEEGKLQLQEITKHYSKLASREETRMEISRFCDAIQVNMNRLMDSVTKSQRGVGHKWSKLKAVSSSIFRETPNVAQMVAESQLLCPMPVVKDCVSIRTKALAMKVTCRQTVTSGLFDGYPKDLFGAAQMVAQSLNDIVTQLQAVGRLSATNEENDQ
ncbi:uncharacterized protein LOC121386563 [Gigantopelta aegis]|uniref:uncharacterized protein LOC121386563 n=1 Tax=Gigantopelta aegis TaxID=1735272 RepID=UPI001B88C7AD|nr:uncharacterized protein LOC121386563 [Gigantopelta aegis]